MGLTVGFVVSRIVVPPWSRVGVMPVALVSPWLLPPEPAAHPVLFSAVR